MPVGVTRKRNHFEAVNDLPWLEPMIDFRGLIPEGEAPHFFQPTADPAQASIVVPTLDMVAIGKRGIDPATGCFLKFGSV